MGKWVIKTMADYQNAHAAIQNMFDEMAENVQVATGQTVADILVDVTDRAVHDAPVDLGPLRESGYAELNGKLIAHGNEDGSIAEAVPDIKPVDKYVGEVGFTEKYAFVQHEHMEFDHPKGGRAKYLERNVLENQQRYIDMLRESAKKAIRGEGV